MGYRVAVVGATGNVGREMLAILAEREFPMDEVAAVASSRSTNMDVDVGDSSISISPAGISPCSPAAAQPPRSTLPLLPLRAAW
jgi:aspartate-semialdehyde dehydrogenase